MKDESLHNIARSTVALIRARWSGDHDAATKVICSMTAAERLAGLWSMSGVVEFALRAPSAMDPDHFLDMVLEGIDVDEAQQKEQNDD